MDSLMAVQLRNALDRLLDLERSLPSTLMFDYPTIEGIARYLLERIAPEEASSTGQPTQTDASTLDESAVTALSDDEIAAMLLARDERQ